MYVYVNWCLHSSCLENIKTLVSRNLARRLRDPFVCLSSPVDRIDRRPRNALMERLTKVVKITPRASSVKCGEKANVKR